MQTDRDPQQMAGTGANADGEQLFRQWATRRLALYQDLGQQVQMTVTDLLQLASEFTIRMEEETNQLIGQFRQEEGESQSRVEAMRREMDALRQAMGEEQQAHFNRLRNQQQQLQDEMGQMRQEHDAILAQQRQEHDETVAQQREELAQLRQEQEEELTRQRDQERESIAQQRQQQEDELAQLRQRALNAMEEQMRMAQTERDQMLRDAYAERNRVFAQTRQLSTRLAQLQQALQGLAGVSSFAEQTEAEWLAAPSQAPQATQATTSLVEEPTFQTEAEPSFFTASEITAEAEQETEPMSSGLPDVTETYTDTYSANVDVLEDGEGVSVFGDSEDGEYNADLVDVVGDIGEEPYSSVMIETFAIVPEDELMSLFEVDAETLEGEESTLDDTLFAPTLEADEASDYDLGTVESYGDSVLDDEETAEQSLFADELFAPSFDEVDEEADASDSMTDSLEEFATIEELTGEESGFAEESGFTFDEPDTAVADFGMDESALEAAPRATVDEPAENPRRLVIEGVTRFTLASDLIDRLEQSASIQDVDLLLYEQTTLLLYVQHDEAVSLEALLQQELGDVLEVVQTKPDVMHLRVRM